MKNIFWLLPVLFLACKKPFVEPTVAHQIPVPWTDTSSSHPQNTVFRALIEKYRMKGLPGISLLIRNNAGTWVGATGKADIERNINFDLGQVGSVASITKLFMGTLIFRLMEDSVNSGIGYSALYKPINTWLPRIVTDKIANGNAVTLGDCMKHETGIPDLIEQDKFYLAVLNQPNKNWKAEELLEFIYDKPALFQPRDTAIYSNTNTLLVSMVIDAATGKKHGDLLHQYILTPLALHNTYYQSYEPLPNTIAQGYFDLYNNDKIVNVSNLIAGSGNGYYGLHSNVFDLYRFIDRLLISRTLLSNQSLTLMQTFGKEDGVNRYGYGLMMKFVERGVNAGLGHSGRGLGYSANLFYFPNKNVTHIFLVNYGTDSKSRLRDVFFEFQEELLDITLQ
ncbi:MAG TPA: serine hydrolase [Flavisolibacter sp.]